MDASERAYRYQSPLELPQLEYDALFRNAGEGIYPEPPGLPRQFERKPPLFHDHPDSEGLHSGLPAPAVKYPPAFVYAVRHATLVGFRTILTGDGRFMTDEAYVSEERYAQYLAMLARTGYLSEFWNERTGLVPTPDQGTFFLAEQERRHVHLEGKVVVLCSQEPGNYGSFLFRVLPKLTLLTAGDDCRFLVPAPHNSMRELLSLLGVPVDRMLLHDPHVIYHIERAIVPCLRNPQALLDPETVALYANARERYGSATCDRKIYVSRQNWRVKVPGLNRVMLNELELVEQLRRLGFDIVEPQNFSAREQIEIFSSAKLVVGPQGSGLFNVAFCWPGTKVVDIETAPNWLHAHMCFFGSCGMRYGIFEGSRIKDENCLPGHEPFTVDMRALIERLTSLE